MQAHEFLEAGIKHERDRAATHDKKGGERSIPPAVVAFNALTGHNLTAEEGWLFMALLKACRSQQGKFNKDNYEDGSMYFGLMGETAYASRAPKEIDHKLWDDGEARIENIGPNGNNGEHYEPTLEE